MDVPELWLENTLAHGVRFVHQIHVVVEAFGPDWLAT